MKFHLYGFDLPNYELQSTSRNNFWPNEIDFKIIKKECGLHNTISGYYYIPTKQVRLLHWQKNEHLEKYLQELFERNLKLQSFQ